MHCIELFQTFIHPIAKQHAIGCEVEQDIRLPESKHNLIWVTNAGVIHHPWSLVAVP